MYVFKAVALFLCLIILSACGGGGSTPAAAPVAAYSFKATGGILNDGSGASGLVVLAILRDDQGVGPGLNAGWQIAITGPGLSQPLPVPYADGSASSYTSWRWKGINPASGTYTATATNGTTTLTSRFDISASDTLARPALSKTNDVVSWNAVAGAGSYYYEVTDGYDVVTQSGYLNPDSSSFQLNTLPDGSYSISVFAQTKSRIDLMNDNSAAPVLPAQDNISVSTMAFVSTGGSAGSYNLSAAGGVLYMGQDGGVDRYGLVVWSSILTNATPGAPVASDWSVSVTGPGIDASAPLVFTYPRTDTHHAYWDFGIVPAAGIYTVTATMSGSTDVVSAQFYVPAPTAQLPVVTGVGVTPAANSYTVKWDAVPGAGSYYLNVWADVGGVYTEVASAWLDGSTLTAEIQKTSLSHGTLYDVYLTACTLDMTTAKALPPPSPSQVNMSDNTFAPASFTAQ